MNQFRIEESQLRSWHDAAAARTDLRGVAAVAKELEAHLAKRQDDGTVILSRHQLFTWAEALQGAAQRAGAGPLQAAVDDMRAVLAGRASPPGAPSAPRPAPAALAATPAPAAAPEPARYAPPPVQYVTPGAVAAGAPRGGGSFVPPQDVAATVRELIRAASGELMVVSPWTTGMETLVAEIIALPPTVRVLLVSRRPEREDAAFHQAMDQLGRRRAVTAFSPHVQTRMVIQDAARALVGAASIPNPQASREAAVLLTEAGAVAAARAHFERVHQEIAGAR